MKDKIVLITGGTDGIGLESAVRLAEMGAHIIIVGRNPDKSQAALLEIKKRSDSSKIDVLMADLSIQRQIRSLAEEVQDRYDRIDVLINNAGAFQMRRQLSEDGIELTWALNHLNYFLLTDLLLPMLKESEHGRIINVASAAHYSGKINFQDLEFDQGYKMRQAYSQSKLANVMFTYELARRIEKHKITANCLHPGFVRTNFTKNNGLLLKIVYPIVFRTAISVSEGAETQVYLASSPDVDEMSGKYFTRKKEKRSSDGSRIVEDQKKLWQTSAEMVGL